MGFELRQPSSWEEAFDLLEEQPAGSSVPLAGGTDLLLALEFGRFAPRRLVSLQRLPLYDVAWGSGALRVGSMVPLRQLELDPLLAERLPALQQAIVEVGSVQLRHRATLGGNIVRGSSASDLLPPLLAHDTLVVLRSRKGQRTVRLDEFLKVSWAPSLAAGELVEELRVPAPRPGTYRWQRVRPANDISQLGLAVVRHPSGTPGGVWRLVAGGTSPSVQRLVRAEQLLTSPSPAAEEIARVAQAASEEAQFSTDRRAAEEYRRHLVRVLVTRGLEATREAGSVPSPSPRSAEQ